MGAHVPRLGDVDLQSTWGGFDFLRFHKLHWKVWSNTIIKFEHKNGVCDIAQRQKSALAERERSMVRVHLSQQIAEEWNGAVTMGGRYRCFCPGLPNHNRLITYWYWVRLPFPLLIPSCQSGQSERAHIPWHLCLAGSNPADGTAAFSPRL